MTLDDKAIIYIPDGTEQEKALSRTTHLCIAAHQDDIEFMAFSPIAECFGSKDKYFCGVVTTDGAGSPRNGLYENYTDEYMKAIRIDEQKKAAAVGEYTAQILLGYSSNEVKDKNNGQVIKDYVEILKATKPEYVYIHNLADKHNTHVATAVNAIKALRQLQPDDRPKKAYGCEVWRDLDWLNDDEKILLDCSGHQNLARALSSVFDSQIIGGKRYDVAVEGRRLANATFGQSHSCDTYAALNYAMDLTPLIHDETIDIAEYVTGYIQRFSDNVIINGSIVRKMPYTVEQKIKLLVLWDILCRNTDEAHALNTDEIIEMLAEKGINVGRKVLVQDIDLLNRYGYEVMSYKKKYHYYYVVSRVFDIAEIAKLADVVKASKLTSTQ